VSEPLNKKLFGQTKSAAGRLAKALSISLYPKHVDVLRQREQEFNAPRRILLQLFLEVEQREGILRRELIARLTKRKPRSATT
jgi:hypothetical protein